jgi:two-component system chemotaxis response regulator CheY
MSVLIVDDASIMRMVLKDILVNHCGYAKEDIFEANGGENAISQYKRHKPEIVLMDISMPDISGVDAVKRIIKIDENAKIIMCTVSNSRGDVVECVRAGAKDYIIKPPVTERVVLAVNKVTGRNSSP